jgi:hypothetical protein
LDPWNTDKAVTALTATAMYEAAGSLIWCNAFHDAFAALQGKSMARVWQ